MQDMNEEKSGGTLYVVATPIGHLDDMTYRAVQILGSVDQIACEDTRETKKLLDHFEIIDGAITTSYHAQSSSKTEDELIHLLSEGKNVALVSDRGTPGISDPGGRLIARAVSDNFSVVPIPGASALITALQAAGVPTNHFLFLGFFPHKKGRETLFTRIKEEKKNQTIVFYESPHRIIKTLNSLTNVCQKIVLARELTKMHEEYLRGTPQKISAELSSRPKVQGEFVVIIPKQ